MHWLMPSLVGIPSFFIYFIAGASLLAIFATVYVRLTAHSEVDLIRSGNLAASLAYGGALVGFSLPLSRAVSQAGHIPDLIIWALLALIVQFAAYLVTRRIVPDVSGRIAQGDLAAATILAAVSIACGMLNAASMTM